MATWTALGATLLLLLGRAANVVGRDVDYCYSDNTHPYLLFASKTAYEFVRSSYRNQDNLPHCTPLQVWWLNRHGTRYPGNTTIVKMQSLPGIRDTIIKNHDDGAGRLCESDLERLRAWRLRVTPDLSNLLTPAGEEELYLTARRLRERFPQPLQLPYTAARFQFRHTPSQRTERSAQRFADGLFGDSDAVHIPSAVDPDLLLQPYAACPVWQKAETSQREEWNALVSGEEVKALIANVSSRLGFRYSLTYDVIDTIYDMCRFEKAWNVTSTSAWCAAFSKEELKLLEYAEDLRYYYKSGYGDDLNVELGCPLVKDLYERFSAVAASADAGEKTLTAGVFYFAHSSTLHMLQARLGAYQDPRAPRANNYAQQSGRRWRISQMGSFAANIGAIFYRCDDGSQHALLLGGEGPLDMPGCHVGLCEWGQLRERLRPIAEECSLDWCEGRGTAARLPVPFATALVPSLLTLLVFARAP